MYNHTVINKKEVLGMNTEKVIEVMKGVKNGTFGVIEYESSLPVNKEAKKAGVTISCTTKKMVRFGADYKNLVKELASAEVKPRTNNYSWVIENKVAYNSNTDKNYVRVSNINRKTISKKYVISTSSGLTTSSSLNGWESLLQPSYFKNNVASKPVVQNISVENILSINGIVG